MNKLEKINICFAVDEKYVEYCGVTITSIILNSASLFHFFILYSGISEESKAKLEKLKVLRHFEITFVEVEVVKFKGCYIPEGTHFNLVNYFRLGVASILPKIDKIIYLDSDIIVNKDIVDLWRTSFNGSCIVGCNSMVHDRNCERLGLPVEKPYINSGVMMLNLKRIREDKIEDLFFKYMEKCAHKASNVDQDVINVVMADVDNGIKLIDQNWNVEIRTDMPFFEEYVAILNNPYIIHFITADKPWKENSTQLYKDLYLKYYRTTLIEYNKKFYP